MRFKKIASVLASAAMVFSTFGFAAAANYPQPFVKNGVADVAIVYGSDPAAQADMVAVVNIQNSLNSVAVAGNVSGGAPEGGDFVKLERPSDKFNLGNNAADVFITPVNKDHLPVLLADGSYRDENNNEFKYTQKIDLSSDLKLNHFKESDYSDMPAIGINLDSSKTVLTYKLEFTKRPDFTSAAMKNTDLPLFGKKYFVLEVDGSDNSLTLLDSSASDSLDVGEVKTVTVGGKTYTISILAIDTNGAILKVNGETTRKLGRGDTYKLADGAYLGVKEFVSANFQGGSQYVEFTIGAGKLILTNGQEVQMNDDQVDGLLATVTNSSGKLQDIQLQWKTDSREFITPTSSITMPGFETLKLSMAGFVKPKEEKVFVEKDGSDSIRLRAPIKDGVANFNLLYKSAEASTISGLGKDSNAQLVTSNNTQLTFNRTRNDKWFVVSWATSSEAESYLVSANVVSKDGANRTTVKNEITGQNFCTDIVPGGTCTVGNSILTIDRAQRTDGSNWFVVFNRTSSSSFNHLYTTEGLKILLPTLTTNNATTTPGDIYIGTGTGQTLGYNSTLWYLFAYEEDKDGKLAEGAGVRLSIRSNSDDKIHVHDAVALNVAKSYDSNAKSHRLGDNSDKYETYVISDLATRILHDKTGSEYSTELTYHGDQAYAEVYLTESSTTIGSGSGTIGAPLLDTEVSQASGKNLIVVGGSCVNSVAAELLRGSPTKFCGADWTTSTGIGPDTFLIQTFSRTGGKVATLVAGWSAIDTQNAATALTTQTVDTTAGKKYTGNTATSITPVMA